MITLIFQLNGLFSHVSIWPPLSDIISLLINDKKHYFNSNNNNNGRIIFNISTFQWWFVSPILFKLTTPNFVLILYDMLKNQLCHTQKEHMWQTLTEFSFLIDNETVGKSAGLNLLSQVIVFSNISYCKYSWYLVVILATAL